MGTRDARVLAYLFAGRHADSDIKPKSPIQGGEGVNFVFKTNVLTPN